MHKYSLVVYPKDILRQKTKDVLKIDENIKNLTSQMLEIMYANNGIGLAAPQAGSNLSIAVIDLQEEDVKNPMIIINPKIIAKSSNLSEMQEGCLSLPNIYATIQRPAEITVEFLDLDFKTHTLTVSGLLSTCFQHEIDHLNGKLFIDYLPLTQKNALLLEYKEQQKEIKNAKN